MTTFEFYRFRFHLRAADPVRFPSGKSGNVLRGAFGMLLRDVAPPTVYIRLFEPGSDLGPSPSGLGDWPRPFLFRATHLDGRTIPAGGDFYFDMHVFDRRDAAPALFRAVFERLAASGLGPRRARTTLERVEQLDLEDRAQTVADASGLPCVLTFDPPAERFERVLVRFVTPTELKRGGAVADQPEFPILFGRLRDRVSTLRALYGPGAMDIDFRAMGERAAAVRLERCDLNWEKVERRSARTGQVHSVGGFAGTAEYRGELGEFLPWLKAARWVGVGRQTVWGKGEMHVLEAT